MIKNKGQTINVKGGETAKKLKINEQRTRKKQSRSDRTKNRGQKTTNHNSN